MGSSLLLKGGANTPKSVVETITTSHSFIVGDVVRYNLSTSLWEKAQADSAENSEVAGVVNAFTSTSFDVTYSGYISIPTLTGNYPVMFLDSTIAGGLTASPPSAIGTVVKPVLTKTSNGTGYLVTNYLGTQIGGSSTVAIDEIQPVGTVVPFAGSAIPDSWLECNGASYAVSAYPNLYAKLQYSGGDRQPAYGSVCTLNMNSTSSAITSSILVGDIVYINNRTSTASGATPSYLTHDFVAQVVRVEPNTLYIQILPKYNSNTKSFSYPNTTITGADFTGGFYSTLTRYASLTSTTNLSAAALINASTLTHFNTPDLRGRFAIGANTTAIGELETDIANNSAISAIYSIGSEGGEEKNSLPTAGAATSTGFNCVANVPNDLLNNIPPYTVVRYIIKATPYTRAAIIDGIDIPYTSLLVSDLRDGSLRPNGSGEALVFKTNDGSSGVERMRLTNDGKLGIGTTTPQHTFVVSQGNDTLEFQPGHQTDVSFIQALNRTTNLYSTTLSFRAKDYVFRSGTSSALSTIIDSTGRVNIPVDTESTSLSTGGLTLGGGLGMAKNLTVGGGISAAGGITFSGLTRVTNTTAATSPTVAAFTVAGGIGAGSLHVGAGGQSIAGPLNVTGETRVDSAAASSSTTSGALRVVGGVGIQGALYVGGITTAGGISMGGALTVGGGITAARLDCSGEMKSGSVTTGTFSANTLSAIAATPSTTTGTGALVVAGGAGIALALNVGGGITAARLDLGTGAIKTTGSLNCGNIVSTGTFTATSLNASTNTTSTSTGSGALVVAGGAGIAGAVNVGGGISAAGYLNLGMSRNYTTSGGYSPFYMMRALGSHVNTKIQLVSTGSSELFGGNTSVDGAALLMWASEPNQTYSGCGIGANLTTSPGGAVAESRQFTEQAQTFIRFTDNGRIGFHTSAVGATASMTPKVAILSTGGLDVQSGIVSTSTASGALVITGVGGAGIGGALNVGGALNAGATASFSGNVGIGANASSDRLTIDANTSGYSGGILHSNLQSSSYYRIIPLGTNHGVGGWANSSVVFEGVPNPASSGNTIIGSFYNDLVFQTGARANRMRITPTGKVGIGITTPVSPLHVVGPENYGSSANSGIVTIGNANNSRQINLGVSDTNSVVYIEGWVPGVGGSHLVLQPSGGRVGIGKSAPTQALDVVGSIVASGAVTATTTITPGAWANGSAPKSYISTAVPAVGDFPISGSIWFVV